MKLRTLVYLLGSMFGAASLLRPQTPAETISGFCRQQGSLNVLPFTLNTGTGAIQTFPAYTVGADRAGHYVSVPLAPGTANTVIATGLASSAGATPEKLVSVDLTNGTVTPSSSGFSNAAFTGNSMSTMPGMNPWSVAVAQAYQGTYIGSGTPTPATVVSQVDVASGTVSRQITVPYQALPTSARFTPARVFLDTLRPTIAWLLQPCSLAFPQQLVRIDTTTWTILLTLDLQADFCIDAGGIFQNRMFGLGSMGSLGTSAQLVRINFNNGFVTPVGLGSPAGWRRAPMSPYVYSPSPGANKLYAFNDAQNSLAAWDLVTGNPSTIPVTVASPCGRGSITSFASRY